MTGWRRIREVMAQAGMRGPHASPKGLRHGFGVAAVTSGVPLNLVQKWLGHAQLSTTAIYADAVGEEEHAIADNMWRHHEQQSTGSTQTQEGTTLYRQTQCRETWTRGNQWTSRR